MRGPAAKKKARLAMPLTVMVQRFMFLLLVGLATALLIMSRVDNAWSERMRAHVVDAFAPIFEALSRPVDTVRQGIQTVEGVFNIFEENQRLREENARLKKWVAVSKQLEHENGQLRQQLRVAAEVPTSYISARVIEDSTGPFVRQMIINAGRLDGADRGQAVINAEGLVGRVIHRGERASRVLLITDLNSRIPVAVGKGRHRGIMKGTNDGTPQLTFLPPSVQLQPGDEVITSGHGGAFPPGIPVGRVIKVEESGPLVQPYVNWNQIEYVRTVRLLTPVVDSPAPLTNKKKAEPKKVKAAQ